jgi:hypothetical protein
MTSCVVLRLSIVARTLRPVLLPFENVESNAIGTLVNALGNVTVARLLVALLENDTETAPACIFVPPGV